MNKQAKTWEETVMGEEQLDGLGYPILPLGDRTGSRRVAQAQAKLTWEALINRIKEWGDGDCPHTEGRTDRDHYPLIQFTRQCEKCWQAFLKDLGVKGG